MPRPVADKTKKNKVIAAVLRRGGRWADLFDPVNTALEAAGFPPFSKENVLRMYCSREGLIKNPKPVGETRKKMSRKAGRKRDKETQPELQTKVEKKMDYKGGTEEVTTRSLDIRDPKKLYDELGYDPAVFEMHGGEVKTYQVTISAKRSHTGVDQTYTMFACSAKFRLRKERHGIAATKLVAEVIKGLKVKIPRVRVRKGPIGNGGVCGYIGAHDHHFAKLAWARETGEHYDLKIAKRRYIEATERTVKRAARAYNMSEWVLPVGHDFFQINNDDGTTKKGTPQDFEGRLPKIIQVGKESVIESVGIAAQVAPVKIRWVPGNHDPDTSFFLMMILEEVFRKDSRVTVEMDHKSRKYHRFGCNLFGLTHGNEEKHVDLPIIMAGERSDFGETTDHWWFLGHYHKKKELRFIAGDTMGPVILQILPSLSGTDAWHFRKGYVNGIRAWETYYFDYDDGFIGTGLSKVRSE